MTEVTSGQLADVPEPVNRRQIMHPAELRGLIEVIGHVLTEVQASGGDVVEQATSVAHCLAPRIAELQHDLADARAEEASLRQQLAGTGRGMWALLGELSKYLDVERERRTAEHRDPGLRQKVYDRDGGCCRYCRSGPLAKGMGKAADPRRALQFDHVDPARMAGPDGENYVTGCARCNDDKGGRTPAEAGMVLLPVPTVEEIAVWHERGEQLVDRPGSGDAS